MILATASQTAPRRASRRAAFTLLEVLVVVAILVILAGVGVAATTRYLEDARKSKAQTSCAGISQAISAYMMAPANDGSPPSSPQDLLSPPWGGTGYLKNGAADLKDPWGNDYQMEPFTQGDGSTIYRVFTYAKSDNTPISQFGQGPKSGK